MSEPAIDLPEPSPLLAEHRRALGEGRLVFQRCRKCGNAWLPPRERCPRCLADSWDWEQSAGRARVVSWVVYRRAYHPAFADRVPYNVIVAGLDEGPRLISNVVGIEAGDGLFLDAPLLLAPEREGEVPVARFRLAEREHEQGQQQQGQERVER
ncbi:MAG: Zn-ribbon domain-containing OB-fold protein [Solirubrobacteraceae bacterium]